MIRTKDPLVADMPALQARHTMTSVPRFALGTKLAVSVALSVAGVVVLLTFGAMRLAAGQIEIDLRETARLTAVAVADFIEQRPAQFTSEGLLSPLRDFVNAAVDLESITVFRNDGGAPVPVVSTSAVERQPLDVVGRVMTTGEEAWANPSPQLAFVAVPVRTGGAVAGAVVVSVSLGSVARLERTAGYFAAITALLAIALLTLLIHLLARRLILSPLEDIVRVMRRAQGGDLTARATGGTSDELGDVASGLNAMLGELSELHRSLNARVDQATTTLQQRNEQLVRSYESVVHLQEVASRAQELAAVGQTVANVAHQIGTPLNLVSGHVQLLQQEATDPVLQRRLQIVQDQVERVTTAVRELLERARPRREPKPVSLTRIIGRLGDAIRARLHEAGIQLRLELDSTTPEVLADETQLELALVNLVTNAADAMPSGGSLTLRLARQAGGVQIEVHDTGSGISPEVSARMFSPWFTTKPAGKGTGLGLPIARDVVEGMGGTLAVTSMPGVGTTFTITLPAADTPYDLRSHA